MPVVKGNFLAKVVLILGLACLGAISLFADEPAGQAQKTFATPDDAAASLVATVKAENMNELKAIFGPEGEDLLSSGDPVDDHNRREVFVLAYNEYHELEAPNTETRTLILGNEKWPFPIPIVKDQDKWRFDTKAGMDEIFYRRIGRNELKTIEMCQTYVAAQKEYASQPHDGKSAGIYAQKFLSTTGKEDGLYWESKPGKALSPLGNLMVEATAEGYKANPEGKPIPFYGYYYRILTTQGKEAPGGAKSYLDKGDMKNGFAMLAHPAEYADSGVMTFLVNQDGTIYQKDLGEETSKIVSQMTEFNPDSTWKQVTVEEAGL